MNGLSLKQTKRLYWASGIVSICGIIFEVLFGALGSYILGDGVKQYTLTIALFLTGMGIGAFISEKVTKGLIRAFIIIEFLIALVGGMSSFLLFGVTAYLPEGSDALFLYLVIIIVGGLTGLELPLLIRKANDIGEEVNRSTARVLFSDYSGGLIGGLLFAFWMRPTFGMVKTAFVVAIVNLAVSLWMLVSFKSEIRGFKYLSFVGGVIGILLLIGLFFGDEQAFLFEQKLYKDPIVYSKETKYQHIIITKEQGDTRLFLDGNLQFSSSDEYRYHEVLVHPTVALAEHPQKVLILGGGDGLATRELLKYPDIRSIQLVDLDPAMTHLAKTNPLLTTLNKEALMNSKVHIKNEDAFEYLKGSRALYDVILIDLPDPNNTNLNKLYTEEFYSLVRNHLSPTGAMMVQATSPTFATKVYWTIDKTVKATGLHTAQLHVDVPSFGDWGFVLAARHSFSVSDIHISDAISTKFLNDTTLRSLTAFSKDIDAKIYQEGKRVELQPNTLIHPNIIEMYQQAWLYY
ncbi:polyamine aminopropyltransferase [Pullulanibacillus pueri]|uniref:polyamine aminopropyltransferase n=1 Tax=Pullulanibacillus pueri TaxID=1437324 RepID=UPI00166E32EC|nr:polyamine aminopropyltransferase [Pullulanibacillus pueri]